MAWLGNWSKRIKLTIDHERIDGDLTDFPVLVTLADDVGRSNTDVTDVFDELISVSGTKKIAITTNNGITKCYVEIERWDWDNEEAYLWTKIPTIVPGTDTDFYLYYDKDQLDNDVYVGDIGSTPGQTVWDSNFKAVYHFSEDPTGGAGCIKDSTSSPNHGTPNGSMTSGDLVDGQLGKALDFDGTNDYIDCGSDNSLDDINTKTIEAIIYMDTFGELNSGRIVQKANANIDGWNLIVQGDLYNRLYFAQDWSNGTFASWRTNTSTLAVSTWYGVVITYDKGSTANNPLMYIDGNSGNVTEFVAPAGTCDSDAANSMWIGARNNSGSDREFDGKIDEVRISNTIRSDAWIKATYYSNWDNLMVFSESQRLVFTCSGTVQVNSILTNGIDVRLYRRSTGMLVEETTTISGGLFEIDSYYDEDHYIVALYTASGTNALIYDYVSP